MKDTVGAALPGTCLGPFRVGGIVGSGDCPSHKNLYQWGGQPDLCSQAPKAQEGAPG